MVVDSTLVGNGLDGIDAYFPNVEILNSTVNDDTGPGVYCESSSGTIEGSTFAQNRGEFGDGIEIIDGHFTITDNTFDSNSRAGAGFFSGTATGAGPFVRFSGNTVRANAGYGVLANPARNVSLEGNLVKDNGRGIRLTGTTHALLTNNIIIRSTDPDSGHGVDVAGTSDIRLVNNTIYMNALRGISLAAGATVSIYNTIVSNNGAGDLLSVSADRIQFSLIGDGSLGTAGNNISGNPRFVSPDAEDFNLAPDSPALDMASNTAPELPFLDFNHRLRVAAGLTAGGLPGDGRADIGAIEANSSFPLIFPLVVNGAQPLPGGNFTCGFAVFNQGSSSTDTTFAGFDAAGGLIPGSTNPAGRSISAGSQLPILGFQLFGFGFGSASLGGALAASGQRLAGFSLVFDPDFSRFADGVSVSDRTGTDLLFMRHRFDPAGKARYIVFNPGSTAASVTARLFSPAGADLESPQSVVIAPRGQHVFAFENVTISAGYVRVQSDRPLSGVEIMGNSDDVSMLGASFPGSEARLYFPHFAVNEGFSTSIGIVNTGDTSARIVLTARDESGRILGEPAVVNLGPRAQVLRGVGDILGLGPGALTTGYIVAESDLGGIEGFTEFAYGRQFTESSALVPAVAIPQQNLVFSHIAHHAPAGAGGTYQTGIALLNPFGTSVGYRLRVFDATGAKVAETSDVLGPLQKVAKLLSHPVIGAAFFTQPLPLSNGHIEVEADYGIIGFEAFFTENLESLAFVPPQVVK